VNTETASTETVSTEAVNTEAVNTESASANALSTQPVPVPVKPTQGGLGVQARRWWRQLTSMRTALILLFLLALAAVPGSLLPQRSLNPAKVDQYLAAHPALGPWLDRLDAFDVFASPWFAAIYLLLFVSLVGCVIPRIRLHARAMRQLPPAAPKRLDRLPFYAEFTSSAGSVSSAGLDSEFTAGLADRFRRTLRGRRWRTTVRTSSDGTVDVAAEKGYLKEIGNLVFHLSLVFLLIGVAAGSLWGWKANVLLTEGTGFCNTLQGYDSYDLGRAVTAESLPPFCVKLNEFSASFRPDGQPAKYQAEVEYSQGADDSGGHRKLVQVNDPLRLSGARVYLIDHGYAPILRYTDRYGRSYESPNPFLPNDANLSSDGVAIFADANQPPGATERVRNVEVAFEGVYTPTAPESGPKVRSVFPGERSPGITLVAYRGDTGLSAGIPRSVYSLDQGQVRRGALKTVGSKFLRPGQTWKLDDGSALTFVGTREWAGLRVDHDPGQLLALGAGVLMVIGLIGTLTVRRRRIWVRVRPGGQTLETGGLTRTDADDFTEEFRRTVAALTEAAVRDNDTAKNDTAKNGSHAGKD
jgi:cytochrome c biogenesis protein